MSKRRISEVCSSAVKRNRVLCLNCKQLIYSRKETSLKCTMCADWIHLRCSTLTSADLQDKDKLNAVKCIPCTAGEEEDMEQEGAISAVEANNPSLDHGAILLKQILAELKAIKKSMKNLENENAELKASVMSLTDTNNRLVKQVAVLQRSANIGNRQNRSESRVRLATDVLEKPMTQKRSSLQRNRSPSSIRGNSMRRTHGVVPDQRKRNMLIKRVDRRSIPSPEESPPPTRPRLPTTRTRIQTRKLHISNMCETVTAEAVYKHVVAYGKVHPITVKKLRNRAGGNGSRFFIEVLDIDYDNIINDELWENDTEIAFYRGPLRADLVMESFPKV